MAYDDAHPNAEKKTAKSPSRAECGMAHATELIGDRWTLLIIREALYGVTRFDAIQANLAAPRSVLSGRLKKLCEIGVLQRRPYREVGQRVRYQYVLTAKGMDLAVPMIALMQWGEKHSLQGNGATEIVERATSAPCHVGLVNENGSPVDIGATQLRLKTS